MYDHQGWSCDLVQAQSLNEYETEEEDNMEHEITVCVNCAPVCLCVEVTDLFSDLLVTMSRQ